VETLRGLKASGTDVAIYSDTEASSMIRRLWLMAHNARRTGVFAQEDEMLHLVDHFYSHPSIDDDSRILRDVDLRFVQKIKEKMSIWTSGVYKPAPDYLRIIMKDFGAQPAHTVMVGDTHNDGGGAVPNKVSFAWAHYGARIAPEIEKAAKRMASSHYKYGVADIQGSFDATCRPDVILQESIAELREKFSFVAGNGFSPYSGVAATGPRRKNGDQAPQSLPVFRLHAQTPLHTRPQPLGPATHFAPKP
jgi:hypothetical protein